MRHLVRGRQPLWDPRLARSRGEMAWREDRFPSGGKEIISGSTEEAHLRSIATFLLISIVVCGCQSTSQHSQAELATICANPANRANTQGNLYYSECQALYPSTPGQLRKSYEINAPE